MSGITTRLNAMTGIVQASQFSIQKDSQGKPTLPSCIATRAPILRGVDLDLDSCIVKLQSSNDSLRLVEVIHDNDPEYSSDTRVWECGIVLSRCMRQEPMLQYCGSLLRDGLLDHSMSSEKGSGYCHVEKRPFTCLLDLGSGTGVVGLAVARLGIASQVFLTEMDTVVPLLELNAHLNSHNKYRVVGPDCEAFNGDATFTQGGASVGVNVHVHSLDWRESGSESGCRFAVMRAFSEFNKRALDASLQGSCDRVTIIASDCVYSPREVDDFISVLRNLVQDLKQIEGIRAFEIIIAIRLRLYSETNRSACAKFLSLLGEWVWGATPANTVVVTREDGERQTTTEDSEQNDMLQLPVWRSAQRTLQEVQRGNPQDDLALRCGLTSPPPSSALLLDTSSSASNSPNPPSGFSIMVEDVKWKRELDLSDLKPNFVKKTGDISILRISGELLAETVMRTSVNHSAASESNSERG